MNDPVDFAAAANANRLHGQQARRHIDALAKHARLRRRHIRAERRQFIADHLRVLLRVNSINQATASIAATAPLAAWAAVVASPPALVVAAPTSARAPASSALKAPASSRHACAALAVAAGI